MKKQNLNLLLRMKMNRRNLLLGIAAVPIAWTAYALSWSDIKDAVTGHVDDIIDRRKDDAFAPGHPYAMSTFREDDIGPVSYTHLTLPTTPYV